MSMVDKFKAFCGDAVRPDKLKTKSWRKCVDKRNGFTDSVASRTCINSSFAGTDHWTGSIRRNSSQSLCGMFRCSLQIIISQVHRLHLGGFFLFCSHFAYWTCLAYTPLSPSCPHCSWFKKVEGRCAPFFEQSGAVFNFSACFYFLLVL